MSVNEEGRFVPSNNNPRTICGDQGQGGYQGSMNYTDQNNSQTSSAGAMNGLPLPYSAYEDQVSDPRHISFAQEAGRGFNGYVYPHISEQLQSQTHNLTLDDNNTQWILHDAYSHNEKFQPRPNHGIGGASLLTSSSDTRMQSRTGGGFSPPILPESSTGDFAPCNSPALTSMQTDGIGHSGVTNMTQAGRVRRNSRRSPLDIFTPPQYDSQNGFASERRFGMQSNSLANMTSNEGFTNGIFRHQAEPEGWTRDQIPNYYGAVYSGHAYGQAVLENRRTELLDGVDMNENSDSTVGSSSDQDVPTTQELPTVQGSSTAQGTGSLAGDDRRPRSGMGGLGSEPMSSRQFRGHSDRALHRVGGSQQRVGKPPGKRSKGATDPVNIEIVNWYDNHGMSFAEIAQQLNNRLEARGKPGTFTPNSIHNRYNRCAPIMYRATGRVFVAIRNRKKHAPEELDVMSNSAHSIEWTPQKDYVLKRTVEKYEANKWPNIAAAFINATGEMVSAGAVATRFGLIQ